MSAIHCPMFGEALGDECIADGIFIVSISSPWILTADWTVSGGTANYTPGSELVMEQVLPSITSGTYRTSFDISSGSGSLRYVIVGDAGAVYGTARSGVGTYVENLVYPGTPQKIRFAPSFGSAAVSIDNVSLKRVY